MPLLLVLMMLTVEVDSFELRHFDERQFGVGDERRVPGVDVVAQRLRRTHTVLHIA